MSAVKRWRNRGLNTRLSVSKDANPSSEVADHDDAMRRYITKGLRSKIDTRRNRIKLDRPIGIREGKISLPRLVNRTKLLRPDK